MTTYNVKQIADMLDTNPETVRRWIRTGKLKAIQASRKEGNQISEMELRDFLKNNPKYSYFTVMAATSLIPGLGLAAPIIASIAFYKEQVKKARVTAEDLKAFLEERLAKIEDRITQKEELIKKTQEEISNLQMKAQQYRFLIKHDELIEDTIKQAEDEERMIGGKE